MSGHSLTIESWRRISIRTKYTIDSFGTTSSLEGEVYGGYVML